VRRGFAAGNWDECEGVKRRFAAGNWDECEGVRRGFAASVRIEGTGWRGRG